MKKLRMYLGYAIGCSSCLIAGMTMSHVAALYYHDANQDETVRKMACKNGNLLHISYPMYAKNVLKEVIDFYKDEVF